MSGKMILGGIACLALLGGILTAPAQAAGTVDGIVSDTTAPVARVMGQEYRFTVTLPQNAAASYTAGNGNILDTFMAAEPTRNRDGTTTFHYGFRCLTGGDTGVYVRTQGKTVRLFTVHVSPDYVAIQEAVDNGHQPWRLNPAEVAAECVAENKLQAKTDTWDNPAVAKNVDGSATVFFAKDAKPVIKVVVYQPFQRADSIWAVRSWTDLTTNETHTEE